MAMAAYIIGMQKIASLASPKTELLSRDFLSSSRMTSNSEVVPGLFGLPVTSYKRECQDKYFPLGSMPVLFCLGIQPNCLNVVSYSESGLLQAKGFALSPRARRRCDCSPLWFHFAVVTAPIVF